MLVHCLAFSLKKSASAIPRNALVFSVIQINRSNVPRRRLPLERQRTHFFAPLCLTAYRDPGQERDGLSIPFQSLRRHDPDQVLRVLNQR
ncbi:hypothetical protein MnTg02_02687 [bacterium MnTg02]|nr:hypothetical protein MnTg02_02687 [bacterium MnTg02]